VFTFKQDNWMPVKMVLLTAGVRIAVALVLNETATLLEKNDKEEKSVWSEKGTCKMTTG
jgi:hypothetical protein